jgi:GntR family transcriptional regulator, arabinose operon transcriptional repressor
MEEKIPKYMAIVNWVKKKVDASELCENDKLYSENELSKMFLMSRQTVRHGISKLEQEGIVKRVQGSGTYVCKKNSVLIEKTMNIAVVTTYVDSYIFPKIIKEIEKLVSKAGYITQIAFTNNTLERESFILESFLTKNLVDGIIIEPTKSGIPNPNIGLYQEIMKRKIPIIFLNSYYAEIDASYVAMDDAKAGLIATNYLIEAGHRKIAGIFKSDDRQGHFRYAGYVDGLIKSGIKVEDKKILWMDTEDLRNIDCNEDRILNRLKGCTACLCYNDQVARIIIDVCKKKGINIPEQLSIISIDDSDLAKLSEIPLTSVAYPVKEIGKKITEKMFGLMEDSNNNSSYIFTPTLTIRDSVRLKE